MKVRIDIDENLKEDEILIRCGRLNERVQRIYDSIVDVTKESRSMILHKANTEYYIPMESILFFETSDNCISAHTIDNVYEVTYRLYELEELLPGYFLRVSKSSILNINHILAISRNLSASSEVQFLNSHKRVFVSRHYYKILKSRLEEKRKSI